MSVMRETIWRQPADLRALLADPAPAEAAAETLRSRRIFAVGTGTSWHAANHAVWLLREAEVEAMAVQAMDAALYGLPARAGDAVLVLSHRNTKRFSSEVLEGLLRSGEVPVVVVGGRDSPGVDVETVDQERSAAFTASHLGALMRVSQLARALGAPLDGLEDVPEAVEAALGEFEKLGATRVPIGLPNSGHSVPAYYVIAPAEPSSNLSRFDGVRYGHRAKEHRDLADMYFRTRAEGFGAEVRRRILIGTYVLSHGYYDAYYVKAQKIRRLIADDFAAAFKQCDVIVGPTAPTVAFKIGAKAADPVQMYLNDIYTIPVNLAGLPGMSIPCGFGKDDLPVGLHIVGNYFGEAKMLNVAHQYQKATDWHKREPTGIQR